MITRWSTKGAKFHFKICDVAGFFFKKKKTQKEEILFSFFFSDEYAPLDEEEMDEEMQEAFTQFLIESKQMQ